VLVPHAAPITRETPVFRALVKGAFSQRRKKLRNAWASLLEASKLKAAALRAGVDLEKRGETLAVEDFARMAAEVEAA